MVNDVKAFWETFEKETGEKVEVRSIGEWFKASDTQRGYWGLLVLTDKSFRFKYMPSDNWLSSIFKRSKLANGNDDPIDIVIPRLDISAVVVPKRGFFSKLFGPVFERITICSRGPDGERDYLFSVDPSTGLTAALAKACTPAERGS